MADWPGSTNDVGGGAGSFRSPDGDEKKGAGSGSSGSYGGFGNTDKPTIQGPGEAPSSMKRTGINKTGSLGEY